MPDDNENTLSAAELDSLLGTTTQNVSKLPDEGVAEYEVSEVKGFNANPKFDADDIYQVLHIMFNNCDNPAGNQARIKVKLYCDRDPISNDWVRDDDGNPAIRGAGGKQNPLTHADPSSPYGKLLAAIWPREADRLDKDMRDIVGEHVKLAISYDEFNGNPYAKVAPRAL